MALEDTKDQVVADSLNAPIPGQGLTQDPENPQPWETPPEIMDVTEAREIIFERLIDPSIIGELLTLVENGMPVSKIASMVVKQGFREGLWTPDLVLSLMEPTALMIIAIAKEFDFEPVIIDEELARSAEEQLDFIKKTQEKVPENIIEEKPEGLMAPMKGGV